MELSRVPRGHVQQVGQHAQLRLIDHRPDIDAVFAASDLMAAGATMGACMVSEILAQIADPGREPSHVVLSTELILRGSA